jgi:carbamoyl-phosphate synthase large subunit
LRLAAEIGYPLVVRPSYVLGGRAMEIVHEQKDLERYMREAVKVSNDSPVLLDRFLNDAIEVDVDALSDGEQVLIGGIMEHIEQAGVHSGDSACSLPPYSLSKRCRTSCAADRGDGEGAERGRPDERAVRDPGRHGWYVLEVNPRASRTVPFVSKATGRRWPRSPRAAWPAFAADRRASTGNRAAVLLGQGSGVPVQQVPRRRHHPRPGNEVDRRSHGRRREFRRGFRQVAAGAGVKAAEAGQRIHQRARSDKPQVVEIAQALHELGFSLVATRGTARRSRRPACR